ncbi:MAG: 50S ribosomal protein L9 [Candidatus Riflebacteria bacterium]|nr:50S ribosomal protein L9 [Candidatus Riflebacteria bacterium]
MEVLLTNDVDRLGRKGDKKKVSEGYARNFLFPRSLAVRITDGVMSHHKLVQASWAKKALKEKNAAQEIANKIEGHTLKVYKRSGDKGRLFGSVTSTELVELIKKEIGVEIDKRHLITDHIKELGQYDLTAKISVDVKAKLKVVVLQDETVVQTSSKK